MLGCGRAPGSLREPAGAGSTLPGSEWPTCRGSGLVKNKNAGLVKWTQGSRSSQRLVEERNQQPKTGAWNSLRAGTRRQGAEPVSREEAAVSLSVGASQLLWRNRGAEVPSAPDTTMAFKAEKDEAAAGPTCRGVEGTVRCEQEETHLFWAEPPVREPRCYSPGLVPVSPTSA